MAWKEEDVGVMTNLPFGEITKSDEDLLRRISKKASEEFLNASALELGTFLGRSAIILSENMRMVYTIDVFEDVHTIKYEASKIHYTEHLKKYPRTYKEVKDALSEYKNIHIFKGITSDKIHLIDDDTISLLFFDADHTFEGLKRVFNLCYPKLKKGGYLIVHDSGEFAHWMEPILFVATLRDTMEKIDESDISTAWKKL